MRGDHARLEDMLAALLAIERQMPETAAQLETDEKLLVWMVYHLQIIGEAARQLSQATRDKQPELPWPELIGLRNVLVHRYFELQIDLLWEAITGDLPAITAGVRQLLEQTPN